MKKWSDKCECGKKKSYNEEYDAYYCKSCNKWLETMCSDRKCEYCAKRPDKPTNNTAPIQSDCKLNTSEQ